MLHSEERLATGDNVVRMLRRPLREQIEIGANPINVGFDAGAEVAELESGQFFQTAAAG